jgi:phage terminase large subunit-like protein
MFSFNDKGFDYYYGTGQNRDYQKICDELNKLQQKGNVDSNDKAKAIIRRFCKEDLFFLLYFILSIKPVNHPWIYDRIREVEKRNDLTLDLWAREHFKSTIITFGLIIQEILNNPEERIGIFSNTRQVAKAFQRRVKIELESNELLKASFDDILYQNPERQSPKWSEDEGCVVKRRGSYNEATVEACGIDVLPTGKHFTIVNYDDLVDQGTVNTPEQMAKSKNMFKLSDSLGSMGCKKRIIGTIYHYMDLNQELSESGDWLVRKYPAEDEDGNPVLMTKEELRRKRKVQGSYVFACQLLLNPVAKENQKFLEEWISYYRSPPEEVNKIILVDPANEKKPSSAYTVMACLGVDRLRNYYLLDMVRDKFKLNERWDALKKFAKKNSCRAVYYEKNGLGAVDIQHHKEQMRNEGIFFNITPINNATESKDARIEKLQPIFEDMRFHLPDHLVYYDTQDNRHDLIHEFKIEEYLRFPYCTHFDMMDCIASMKNKAVEFYPPEYVEPERPKEWNPFEKDVDAGTTYMSM